MAKTSTAQSLKAALKSWRLGAVALLSFSSGLPYGLVVTAVPTWLKMAGVDIKTIGLVTLAQAPYAFKFLWSPWMDRYRLPWLGRKRGWIVLAQLALAALTFALAAQAASPQVAAVGALALLVAFASASQDIAIDAYTVESLRPDEQGIAVGARTALYRLAMYLAGAIAVTLAGASLCGVTVGWGPTLAVLAALFLMLVPAAALAPEPEALAPGPRSMREAVWEPFVSFFQKPRALEVVGFLLLYKLGDNLAISLIRPFLVDMRFSAFDVGLASGTISLAFTIAATFVGGYLTTGLGLGRALWLFGILQSTAGVGYALIALVGANRPLMYAAMALEAGASGLGTGAFMVLLMRLTEKRFSATQYALFSSVFALGRTIAGPIAGSIVDAVGWRDFFLFTIVCGVPGLAMLQRFVPWGERDLVEPPTTPESHSLRVMSKTAIAARSLIAGIAAAAMGILVGATLSALKESHAGRPFELLFQLAREVNPQQASAWVDLVGAIAFGLVVAFGVAAYLAARRGQGRS